MTTKKTKVSSVTKPMTLTLKPDVAITEMTDGQKHAMFAVEGSLTNAATIGVFLKSSMGELSLNDCMSVLKDQVAAVHSGNLSDAESLLTCQAASLNTIFTELARRAANNMGEHFDAFERYLRLALKAQNQCRATLETLAAIKNPPVVFTKQANINHGNGNQQINNGTLASDVLDNIHPHAEKSKKSAKRTIRGATWQQDSGHQSNGQSKQS
jgi:hypothetical protein